MKYHLLEKLIQYIDIRDICKYLHISNNGYLGGRSSGSILAFDLMSM